MTDLDRWVDLEGPPPSWLREVLDPLAPPLSPDHEAALDLRIRAAIAEDRRLRARRRRRVWTAATALVAALLVASVGGGVLLARRQEGLAVPQAALSKMHAGVEAPDGGAPAPRAHGTSRRP